MTCVNNRLRSARLMRWLIGVLCLAWLPASEAEDFTYLHEIPIRTPAEGLVPGVPPKIILEVSDPAATIAAIPHAKRQGETTLLLDLADLSEATDPPTDAHRLPSFFVDYDEPDVVALSQRLTNELGAEPSIEQLTNFASAAIPQKMLGRGWDLASRVAAHGEGDCTEHAVLLAAVARAAGRSARVVVGTAFVELDDRFHAYGHAWTEIHDGQSWQRADATRIDQGSVVYYLPQLRLTNEGPGYRFALTVALQKTLPKSVEILATDPP